MGLIVDTGVFIAKERTLNTVADLMQALTASAPYEAFAISVVTLTEFSQGYIPAHHKRAIAQRERFLRHLRLSFPAIPLDERLALSAGRLSAAMRASGHISGFADLVVAATALDLDYGVLTYNIKHFNKVPNLRVVSPQL